MQSQIYVNLLWGYKKNEFKGTTERNNARPFCGVPTCVSTRGMHVSRCVLGDGGDDAGNDADAGSAGGATMMVAMMTVVIALAKLMIDA